MPLAKLLLATALATVIGAAGATAQDAEHHPGTAAEATAPAAPPVTKPAQETVPTPRNLERRWVRVQA